MSSPPDDDDNTPLDEALVLLQKRMRDDEIETKDLCDIAKVFLAAEKAEADVIAKLHGGRGGVTVPTSKLDREATRIESEEPHPLFERDHDA